MKNSHGRSHTGRQPGIRGVVASLLGAGAAVRSSATPDDPVQTATTGMAMDTPSEGIRDGVDTNVSPRALAEDAERVRLRELERVKAEADHPPESPITKFKRVFDGS